MGFNSNYCFYFCYKFKILHGPRVFTKGLKVRFLVLSLQFADFCFYTAQEPYDSYIKYLKHAFHCLKTVLVNA